MIENSGIHWKRADFDVSALQSTSKTSLPYAVASGPSSASIFDATIALST